MKTAIITGAAGNMGRAVVKKFIEEGYKVIAVTDPLQNDTFDFSGNNFEQHKIDVANETASQKFIDTIVAANNVIDAAILTVGGFAMGTISETSSADIAKQYQLNFETAYNIARPLFVQMMKQKSGRIFLIGSKPGLSAAAGKGMVAYSLAKSLIFRLADLMNSEAKGTNVVTSVVVPSTIDTPQNRKAMPDADYSKWVTPEAIASVISFHCSNDAAALREPIIKVYGNS